MVAERLLVPDRSARRQPAASILSCAAILHFGPGRLPTFTLHTGISAVLAPDRRCASVRSGIFELSRQTNGDRKRTLIYGAGGAGIALLREIHQSPALAYQIVGFIDDAPEKRGRMIHRAQVFGAGEDLLGIVRDRRTRRSDRCPDGPLAPR